MTTKNESFETWVAPETHDEKMERLRLEEEHETKRAKYKLREARQETYQFVGGCFAAAAVVIAIVAAIYFGTSGPESGPSHDEVEQDRESACIADGGGWVPDDLVVEGDSGLCVYPGKAVE